jgi:hypothetical protein
MIMITYLNVLSNVCMIDTYLEIGSVLMVYLSKQILITVPIGIAFMIFMCEKIYSIYRLYQLAIKQYKNRYNYNMLDPSKKHIIVLYSCCLNTDNYATAEILTSNSKQVM